MQFLAMSAIATGTALVNSVSYAQAVHVETPQSQTAASTVEETQMIVRPKLPIGFAKNLKFIFDHDLLLEDSFYTKNNLKKIFNLKNPNINKEKNHVSIIDTDFNEIFPRKNAPEHLGGSIASASLVGGKTDHENGSITAGINFSMDQGGPSFEEVKLIFGGALVFIPRMPSPHGGPLASTSRHGNENWEQKISELDIEKKIVLAFNPAGELSSVVIEIQKSNKEIK
jgi:hypothetical protein